MTGETEFLNTHLPRRHSPLSCRGLTSVVRWGGADVWQLTSGWRQGWRELFFLFFLWRESIFLGKKMGEKMKKPFFFSENRATRSQRRLSICLPYTAGGMHSQNKYDRHTDSPFSLLQDNSPRYGRGSQHQGSTRRRSWETFVSNWIERCTCEACLLQQ